jgi:hypothetical protein
MNIAILHNELIAVGLLVSGCDSEGNVHLAEPDTNNLVPLVLAAHGQPLASDECVALQAAITEAQWLAYQECRKAPTKQTRANLYKETTDPLFMAAMEESTTLFDAVEQVYNVKVDRTKWDEWLAAKELIRTENPYPE